MVPKDYLFPAADGGEAAAAPLLRTLEEGAPTGRRQQVALTFSGVATANGTVSVTLSSSLLDADVVVTSAVLNGATDAEVAGLMAAALSADADVTGLGFGVSLAADVLVVTAPYAAENDAAFSLVMSPGATGLPGAVFSVLATGIPLLPAAAIGQECRYGDSAPYRWFKVQQIYPVTLWGEITPGVVVVMNRDTGGAENLFIQDNTLQTEII